MRPRGAGARGGGADRRGGRPARSCTAQARSHGRRRSHGAGAGDGRAAGAGAAAGAARSRESGCDQPRLDHQRRLEPLSMSTWKSAVCAWTRAESAPLADDVPDQDAGQRPEQDRREPEDRGIGHTDASGVSGTAPKITPTTPPNARGAADRIRLAQQLLRQTAP